MLTEILFTLFFLPLADVNINRNGILSKLATSSLKKL